MNKTAHSSRHIRTINVSLALRRERTARTFAFTIVTRAATTMEGGIGAAHCFEDRFQLEDAFT
jgi:hypothetical protein